MKTKHKLAYLKTCDVFAECSVAERLKVGAVIVKDNRIISCGYNALPEHLDGSLEDPEGNTRPEVRHAEKSALMGLTKNSGSAVGASMFCSHSCCYGCAIDIVDSGIEEFYFRNMYRDSAGIKHLLSSGVAVFFYDGEVFCRVSIDNTGEVSCR